MEITTEMLFAIIGELTVQTRIQAKMLQAQQQQTENNNAAAQRTIPDYQAWRENRASGVE
jgi:hypothetical protein